MITRLPVTLVVRAPYVTRAGAVGAFGTDLPLARDGKDRLMLAGSHVVGKLAQAMRDLASLLGEAGETHQKAAFDEDLATLFAAGSQASRAEIEGDDRSTGREARRQITASDFVCDEPSRDSSRTRTRIARDTARGTVASGMLQVIEAPHQAGTQICFKGELRIFGAVLDAQLHRIGKALLFITQVGGLRTVGFGEVCAVLIGDKVVARPASAPPVASRVLLRLRFADPFCAGEARNTLNTYVSATHVPGGVIKGALARQILAAQGLTGFLDDHLDQLPDKLRPLARAFDSLRISHALPVGRGEKMRKPLTLPDSLAEIRRGGQSEIIDLAGLPDPATPVLIDGEVPKARFDWKRDLQDTAKEQFAIPDAPARELRIRTQINPERRAAMASRLFGIEYTRTDQHDFLACVDLPDVEERKQLLDALVEVLAAGLGGIGRGGSFAEVNLETDTSEYAGAGEGRVVLVLQTSALLRSPGRTDDLFAAYRVAFEELGLPAGWTLAAIFVRERLAGGRFFQNRRSTGGSYKPWLLTEPGATFVFYRSSGANAFPSRWLQSGLGVRPALLNEYGISGSNAYRLMPFLPENGYGEVVAGFPKGTEGPSHEVLSPDTLCPPPVIAPAEGLLP